MKKLLVLVSLIGLLAVLFPPLLYLAGSLEKPAMSHIMLAGTLLWFASVPFWMGKTSDEA